VGHLVAPMTDPGQRSSMGVRFAVGDRLTRR
jgi:hypothetical protein